MNKTNAASTSSLVVFQAAGKYHQRGWRVIPVPFKQKNPVIKNWQNLRLTQEDIRRVFAKPCNVGVLLGEPSGWLVDVDLDHPVAAKLAPVFLPPTGAVFGRKSKPASHWLYYCPSAKTAKWVLSKKEVLAVLGGEKETMLLELRSNGCQTVFPPSIHPSGEAIEWASEGEPAQVSKEELERACAKLAAATLLALAWPKEGTRQETALALGGALLRAGWSEEETEEFIQAVAVAAGDEETKKRAETAAYTAKKLGTNPTTGWPRLAELVGEEVTRKLQDWLGVRENRQLLTQQKVLPEVKLWTAQELLEADFPEPSWLVPGLLPEGGLVLLAGKPKVGKSWLALDIACGLSSGTAVCGIPATRRVNALYLALEDTPKRLKNRMVLAGLAPGRCILTTSWPKIGAGGLELLEKTITERNIGVVIVDTLAKVRPREGRVVSLYAADYEVLGNLKELADRLGITVIVVHHLRKTGADDPLEEVSGTTGLTGAVDTVLVLKRGRGQADATLFITGRDVEEQELALHFDSGRWAVLGEAREYAISQERRQLLEAIQELGGAARPKEIAEFTGRPHGSVKHLLRRLEAEGLVKAVGGVYTLVHSGELHSLHSPCSPCSPYSPIHPVNGERRVNEAIHPTEAYSHKALRAPVNAVNAVNGEEHKLELPCLNSTGEESITTHQPVDCINPLTSLTPLTVINSVNCVNSVNRINHDNHRLMAVNDGVNRTEPYSLKGSEATVNTVNAVNGTRNDDKTKTPTWEGTLNDYLRGLRKT